MARVQPKPSRASSSITGSKTGRTTHAPQLKSFAGGIPRARAGSPRGVKAIKGTRGARWANSLRGEKPQLRFGLVKQTGADGLAMLDYDARAVPRLHRIWAVCRIVGLRPSRIRTDRTARGWHVLVWLDKRLTSGELTAFQSLCQSDWKREALNLMRVVSIRRTRINDGFWAARWNILFSEKLT